MTTQGSDGPGCSLPWSGRTSLEHTAPSSSMEAGPKATPRESNRSHLVSSRVETVGSAAKVPSANTTATGDHRPSRHGTSAQLQTTANFDPTLEYCTSDAIFFWQPPSVFSQWTPATFTVDSVENCCAEQFFAAAKARLIGDKSRLSLIMEAFSPAEHKRLGRLVHGFHQPTWDQQREYIVLVASYEKFSQNPDMLRHLLGTGTKDLVEASPYDTVWGIGLAASDPSVLDRRKWRGQNLLGKALAQVRDLLRNSAPRPTVPLLSPPSPASAPAPSSAPSSSKPAIFEVNPSTNEPLPTEKPSAASSTLDPAAWPSDVPSDHTPQVLAISSSELHDNQHPASPS